MARGQHVFTRVDTMVYTKQVADDIERGASGRVWRGNLAGSSKHITAYFPTSVIVSLAICHLSSPAGETRC